MSNPLEHLKALRKDMEEKEWYIDSFRFMYKNFNYIVLVKRYLSTEKKPEYALLKLEFLKESDFNYSMESPANSNGLMTNKQVIYNYFGVEDNPNPKDFFEQFYRYLSGFIPSEVTAEKTESEIKTLVRSLSQSDKNDDANNLYCYMVRRNGKKKDGSLGERSPYNSNKARILRKELYTKLHADPHLSFCFSPNPEDKKTNEEIIRNWHKNRMND